MTKEREAEIRRIVTEYYNWVNSDYKAPSGYATVETCLVADLLAEIDRLRAALQGISDYRPKDKEAPYIDIAVQCKRIAREALEQK